MGRTQSGFGPFFMLGAFADTRGGWAHTSFSHRTAPALNPSILIYLFGNAVMFHDVSDLARRLARHAEAVCRHYLSNGRREGRYWRVGDVHNTPGRSLFVRLTGGKSGKGAAGHWTDGASGEYGDLLDIIRATCGYADFRDVAEEALGSRIRLRRPARLKRRDAYSTPRNCSGAPSRKPICATAALRHSAERNGCVFIRAATTVRTRPLRPKAGPL
jgi:hypothetical protein